MAPSRPVTPTVQLSQHLDGRKVIVVCGRADDAAAWTAALGEQRCLAIALDERAMTLRTLKQRNESGRLTLHHELLATLDSQGWLAARTDAFDPDRLAILITPDPLDPPQSGSRARLGRRPGMWQLCESKAVVDVIWDRLGITRPRCVVADGPVDLATLGELVDTGNGVVCAVQPAGGKTSSGAEGIWWWRGTDPPIHAEHHHRVKLMPLMPGVPIRLHGMVFANAVISFAPLEAVTLPRPQSSTFLCCGATGRIPDSARLRRLTENLGTGLATELDYRGAFSVDGILTIDGFQPTDFNTRLTSAIEASPADIRVELQAANVLAREGIALPDVGGLNQIGEDALPDNKVTIYGAATRISPASPAEVAVRWSAGHVLEPASVGDADAHIRVSESLRGWTITAQLDRSRLPDGEFAGPYAPAIFEFADQFLGTNFGPLSAPFGLEQPPLLQPR